MTDRAGREFWEERWKARRPPSSVGDQDHGVRAHFRRLLSRHFETLFAGRDTRGRRLLEVGCAGSVWLPYFARTFGFEILGLDYSETGCRQAQEILDREGLSGSIRQGDLFFPPEDLLSGMDVVVSFGLVEHFDDTVGCVTALAKLLRPGGLLYTLIPNLTGIMGPLQHFIDPEIYAAHLPLTAEDLAAAHFDAGLEVVNCSYFMSVNFGVCHLGDEGSFAWGRLVRRGLLAALLAVTGAAWAVEETTGRCFPPRRFLAPYIHCAAFKPPAESLS